VNAHDILLSTPRLPAFRAVAVNESGSAPPDAALLAALLARVAQTRDRTAFAALFKHFAPRVKAYLRRGGLEPVEAEEVTQEVMLLLWRKAESFDAARAGAATWVFAIARNARVDYARRLHNLPAAPQPEEESPSAETLILTAERASRLRGALAALGPDQKLIVQLSFFSQTPHAAIARALNLPLGTVKSRIRLAMAKLRALLEDTP
jgi:RNA polymerase sigma-70 factor (ECF subfamily)